MPYERDRSGGIQNGERVGEQHFHANGETYGNIGRWGEKEHLVSKRHRQENLTTAGRDLHVQHAKEVSLERRDRKWVVIKAKFNGKCRRCKSPITQGETIQWHEKLGTKCAPATSCAQGERDDDEAEYSEPGDIPVEDDSSKPSQPASEEDFAFFQSQIADMAEQVQVARKQAENAEERADDAENAVRDAVDLLDKAREFEVVVREPGKKTVRIKVKNRHENFEDLLTNLTAGVNTSLVGAAGSGKTFAARQIAGILKLSFYHIPLGPQTSKSDLMGYNSGSGKYIPSLLRHGVEKGGVILFDEMDAANAAILTVINAIVDAKPGETLGFPDGMVKKHQDCHFIAAMNTYGKGADMIYVGRTQLDGATLDRYAMLNWDIDWALARSLCGKRHQEWVKFIEDLFDSATKQKIRVIIGMRKALMGVELLGAGVSREKVEEQLLWRAISRDDKEKILAGLTNKKEKTDKPDWEKAANKAMGRKY